MLSGTALSAPVHWRAIYSSNMIWKWNVFETKTNYLTQTCMIKEKILAAFVIYYGIWGVLIFPLFIIFVFSVKRKTKNTQ